MIEEHNLTERARGVLFFATYYSSPDKPRPVKPEHILLALLGVDPKLFQVLLATESDDVITSLRDDLKAFDAPIRKSWQATAPPPLSFDAEQAIALAAEESKRLGHTHIGTEHLLLGLIKNETTPSPLSEILTARGFSVERLTAQIQTGSLTPQSGQGYCSSMLRALPVPSQLPPRKPRGFISRAFHRLRVLFAILLILAGC